MFYMHLGMTSTPEENSPYFGPVPPPLFNLCNGVTCAAYWSGTNVVEGGIDPDTYYKLGLNDGTQGYAPGGQGESVWAVRTGDVGAPLPVPSLSKWGLGLLVVTLAAGGGIGWWRRGTV